MSTFTLDQVSELRAIEKARMKRGELGLGTEVQALIARLTSGGVGPKFDDPRVMRAKRLWDKGFGSTLNIDSFDAYLATIPEIPENLLAHDDRFPELVLVDARLGIMKTCEILGVGYSGTDRTFEDFDPTKPRLNKVYWMRVKDGRMNRGMTVSAFRNKTASDSLGLTVYEGLAFYAQKPEAFCQWGMYLTSSVRQDAPQGAAYLGWVSGCLRLGWIFDSDEVPRFFIGSRRR